MGFMKSVYFADDLYERVSAEQNLSNLVSTILRDYYKKNGRTIQDFSISEIRAEKERLNSLADSESLDALNKREEELLMTEEAKKKDEMIKKEKRIENGKVWIKELFIVEDSEIESLAEMYELERGSYKTLIDWGKAKGLTLKEEEIVQ